MAIKLWAQRGILWLGAAVACLAGTAASCSSSKGAIMLSITTDMAAPKDIGVVSVFVETNSVPKYDFLGHVDPDGIVQLPSTLAIVQPDDPKAQVHVRVIGFKPTGEARVARDVLTTVPSGRVGLLRIPLSYLDDGSATGKLSADDVETKYGGNLTVPVDGDTGLDPMDPTVFSTRCDYLTKQQTSIAGSCQPATVDSSTLPTWAESEVFGAGGTAASPTCFDALACAGMGKSHVAENVQPAADGSGDCSVPAMGSVADLSDWNCALQTTDGTGFCSGGTCLVPLDEDPVYGFTVGPGADATQSVITMVPGVCARLNAGAKLVIVQDGCTTKVPSTPLCRGGPTGDGGSGGDADATLGDGGGSDAIADASDAGAGCPPGQVPCGTGDGGACASTCTLATGQPGPAAIAVDDANVYWVDQGDQSIRRAPKTGDTSVAADGGNGTILFLPAADAGLGPPQAIAVGPTGAYWTIPHDMAGGQGLVMKVPLDGGAATSFADYMLAPAYLALDDASVYFTDGLVNKVGLDLQPPQVQLSYSSANGGIVVDSNGVYFTSNAAPGADGSVPPGLLEVGLDGGTPTPLGTDVATQTVRPVAQDHDGIYWVDSVGNIDRISKNADAGTAPTVLVPFTQLQIGGIATDGVRLYWTVRGKTPPAGVYSLLLGGDGGGAPAPLSSGGDPVAVAVDGAGVVYWTDFTDGSIHSASAP